MEQAIAAKVVEAALNLDKVFGALDAAIRAIPDEAERKTYLRALGTIILDVNEAIIRPVVRHHPALDPDRD